ncbi:hypothetical protein T01_14219 [Trichinella spiralis]|uniref:Uncharacterized protein n=1 Tax=Trichinella spiralis TaxID=6334 RepID=A0A0V1BT10_TRISP|nr:hypothetical protein T01_14219 [Trichinella spiralis]
MPNRSACTLGLILRCSGIIPTKPSAVATQTSTFQTTNSPSHPLHFRTRILRSLCDSRQLDLFLEKSQNAGRSATRPSKGNWHWTSISD